MHAIHPLLNCFQETFNHFYWLLSKDSADWYEREVGYPDPPFVIGCGLAGGQRGGWRWRSGDDMFARIEVNWLDPEPSKEYAKD